MANFCPVVENVCVSRGDSPVMFANVKDLTGDVVDVTGYTFTLTVGPAPDPSDDSNQIFQISGTVVDGPNGRVRFQPSTSNTDLTPSVYFYDIQMVTTAPSVRTVLAGQFEVKQDITKV